MGREPPGSPIDPKEIDPPPAWQVPPVAEHAVTRPARFPIIRRGYDTDQVDMYLVRVEERLRVLTEGRPNPEDQDLGSERVRRREFATARRGYDPDLVREYLSDVSAELAGLERRWMSTEPVDPEPVQHPAPVQDPARRARRRGSSFARVDLDALPDRRKELPLTRRAGYEVTAVDGFIDRTLSSLRASLEEAERHRAGLDLRSPRTGSDRAAPADPDVRGMTFKISVFGKGYAMKPVDELLDEIARAFERLRAERED